jgi:hypothetical protein
MRVEIHSKTDQSLVEILERAYKVSYDLEANAAPEASFMLPRDDPKWSAVAPFQEVWIYNDLDELIDVFRIAPVQERDEETGTTGLVRCEGFAQVLQDDFIYDELIFTNETVTGILTTLLGYQTTPRVTLGTIDSALDKTGISTRAVNVNVMRAVWEVRNLIGGFISVDPLPGTPTIRQLNLRADPGQDIGQRIHKGLNLRAIQRSTETQAIVTKVWPLGRGEGRTQQRPSTDKLLAQPASLALVASGRSTLTLTDPYRRYKGWTAAGAALPNGADALDVRSRPMKVWRGVTDETANFEQGADERTLRSKLNDYNPGAGAWTIDYVHADYLIADAERALYGTIGNSFVDKTFEKSSALVRAAALYLDGVKAPRTSYEVSVADLSRIYPDESFERLHLHDKVNVYDPAIGVTTKDRIVAVHYGDMQDPASFTIRVSNVELAELVSRAVQTSDKVRKYEGQPDGATTLLGPDSFEDNVDAPHPYTRNIEIPSDAVSVLSVRLRMRTKAYRYYVSAATSAGGGGETTSSSGGAQTVTSTTDTGGATPSNSGGDTGHTHDAHQDPLQTHSFYQHDHTIGHSHPHAHDLTTANHTHTVDTSHTHVLTLTPGIVETTTPTAIEVKVDGVVASATATSLDDFDLVPWLSKNADGSIVRGLHTVTFTPNGVGRIQATIKGVVFLQSRGVIAG